jgi:hypothetical protein
VIHAAGTPDSILLKTEQKSGSAVAICHESAILVGKVPGRNKASSKEIRAAARCWTMFILSSNTTADYRPAPGRMYPPVGRLMRGCYSQIKRLRVFGAGQGVRSATVARLLFGVFVFYVTTERAITLVARLIAGIDAHRRSQADIAGHYVTNMCKTLPVRYTKLVLFFARRIRSTDIRIRKFAILKSPTIGLDRCLKICYDEPIEKPPYLRLGTTSSRISRLFDGPLVVKTKGSFRMQNTARLWRHKSAALTRIALAGKGERL